MTATVSPGSPATASATAAAQAPRPSTLGVFFAATHAEWTKVRTVRSTFWVLGLAVLATVAVGPLFTAILVNRWDDRSPAEIATFDPLLYTFAGLDLAQLAIGVLGVLVMTSEYSSGQIGTSLTAVPQRRLVLLAKLTMVGVLVTVISLLSCLAAFLIAQAVLAPVGADVSLADDGALRAVLGSAGRLVLVAAIALGLGALLRSTAGAITALVITMTIVPALVLLLPAPWNDNVGKYLPNAAAAAMSAFVEFPDLLSPFWGLLILVSYAAAVVVAAVVAFGRRDA